MSANIHYTFNHSVKIIFRFFIRQRVSLICSKLNQKIIFKFIILNFGMEHKL